MPETGIVPDVNQEVTETALQLAWKDYSTTIEKVNPRLFSILNNTLPTLDNGVEVKLQLASQMQEEELLQEKNALFRFLENRLKNGNLALRVVILKDVNHLQNETFTASDKLKAMMEKNPALALLKQKFNLDLD